MIRAILLECTELPPYADALRYHTGLPVWDAITAPQPRLILDFDGQSTGKCWFNAGLMVV